MSTAGLDVSLPKKYISTIRKVFSEYFVPPNEGLVSDIGTALLFRNSSACDWVKQASLGTRMQHFTVDYGKLDNIQEILKHVTQ